jgi:hypothetical protein
MPEQPERDATARAMPEDKRAQISGITPKDCWSPASVGVHFVPNRKSPAGTSKKNLTVSSTRKKTIRIVVMTETAAAASRAPLMTCSPVERGVRMRTSEVRTPIAPAALTGSVATSGSVRPRTRRT